MTSKDNFFEEVNIERGILICSFRSEGTCTVFNHTTIVDVCSKGYMLILYLYRTGIEFYVSWPFKVTVTTPLHGIMYRQASEFVELQVVWGGAPLLYLQYMGITIIPLTPKSVRDKFNSNILYNTSYTFPLCIRVNVIDVNTISYVQYQATNIKFTKKKGKAGGHCTNLP